MDAKLRYKAKKVKIVFFDIDDTLRAKETGLIPESEQGLQRVEGFLGLFLKSWT